LESDTELTPLTVVEALLELSEDADILDILPSLLMFEVFCVFDVLELLLESVKFKSIALEKFKQKSNVKQKITNIFSILDIFTS